MPLLGGLTLALLLALVTTPPAALAGKQGAFMGRDCPVEPPHCDRAGVGPGLVDIRALIGEPDRETGALVVAPGEVGKLVLTVVGRDNDTAFEVALQMGQTPGVAWESNATRAFLQSPGDAPREETFPFRVEANAAGPLRVPFSIRAGNETAHYALLLDVAGSFEESAGRADSLRGVSIRTDARCIREAAGCDSDPGVAALRIGEFLIRINGASSAVDDEARALVAERGARGTVWFEVVSEAQSALPVNVSLELLQTPQVAWENTLAQAYFAPHGDAEAAWSRSFEEAFRFHVPLDAPTGQVSVPFTVRVGNETRHAAFLLGVVEAAQAAPSAPYSETPAAGLGLVVLATGAAAAALAWRRGRRG